MKKNNKGFFLAETIVVIALVTTIMAFVYPNVSKLYDNYKSRALYYDQTEDIYALIAISKANASNIESKILNVESNELTNIDISALTNIVIDGKNIGGLKGLYLCKYNERPKKYDNGNDVNYNLSKYLRRVKILTNAPNAYRLIGVFDVDIDYNGTSDVTRYASIKIKK